MSALDAQGLPPGYPFNPALEITPRQVRDLLSNPASGLVLIDCRTPGEWNTAKIQGATLIPLDQLPARISEVTAAAAKSGGGVVAVHCHHGGRSLKAAAFLRQHGVEAKSMAGGIDLWSIDIDRSVPRY